MIIYNALINNEMKSIVIKDGIIQSVDPNFGYGDIDAKGNHLIPGLIDVHTHGCVGMDTMDAYFEPMCRFYAEHGVTSFLPTTMTMRYDALEKVTTAKRDFGGAQILGFHFEGPYIAHSQKGAQNEKYIKNPSVSDFLKFKDVKMVTIAPELPGASLEAIDHGLNCITHTYNRYLHSTTEHPDQSAQDI